MVTIKRVGKNLLNIDNYYFQPSLIQLISVNEIVFGKDKGKYIIRLYFNTKIIYRKNSETHCIKFILKNKIDVNNFVNNIDQEITHFNNSSTLINI